MAEPEEADISKMGKKEVDSLEKRIGERKKRIKLTYDFFTDVMIDIGKEVRRNEHPDNIYIKRELEDFYGFDITWENGGCNIYSDVNNLDISYDDGLGVGPLAVFSTYQDGNAVDGKIKIKHYEPGVWEAKLDKLRKLGRKKAVVGYRKYLENKKKKEEAKSEPTKEELEAERREEIIAEAKELKLIK